MKTPLLIFLSLLLFDCCTVGAQVGINTTNFSPGVVFEVNGDGTQGVILTRSNIINLNDEAPLPDGIEDGTLTFNSNTTTGLGYVWWDKPAHTWRYVDPFIGKKELYSNPVNEGDAGDLNQPESTGFLIPIFGNREFLNDNGLYENIDPIPTSNSKFKNLKVNATGRYRIALTLGIESQDNAASLRNRNIIEVRLKITDDAGNISYPGAYNHSTEMEVTASNEDDDGAVSLVEVLELQKGDIISVVSYRANSMATDPVWLNKDRPSSFFIIKIN